MGRLTLCHNSHCSMSREPLELLRPEDIEPDTVEYLKSPPSTSVPGRPPQNVLGVI